MKAIQRGRCYPQTLLSGAVMRLHFSSLERLRDLYPEGPFVEMAMSVGVSGMPAWGCDQD